MLGPSITRPLDKNHMMKNRGIVPGLALGALADEGVNGVKGNKFTTSIGIAARVGLSVAKGITKPTLSQEEVDFAKLPKTSDNLLTPCQNDRYRQRWAENGYKTRKTLEATHSAGFGVLAQPVLNGASLAQKAIIWRAEEGLKNAKWRLKVELKGARPMQHAFRGAKFAGLLNGGYDLAFHKVFHNLDEQHNLQGAARQIFGFGVATATGAAFGPIYALEINAKPGESMADTINRLGCRRILHPRNFVRGGALTATIGAAVNISKQVGAALQIEE